MAAAGQDKYAHYFECRAPVHRQGQLGAQPGRYLYTKPGDDGRKLRAQILWDVDHRDVKVRKVPRSRRQEPAQASVDNEVSLVQGPRSSMPGNATPPKMAEFVGHDPASHATGPRATGPLATGPRGSYWKFYNGPSVEDYINSEEEQDDPRPFPHVIVARFARQILSGLRRLYSLQILHQDLSPMNVLVHFDATLAQDEPDFYIIDFGDSEQNPPNAHTRKNDLEGVADMIESFLACGEEDDPSELDDLFTGPGGLIPNLRTNVYPAFPNLDGLINQAQQAEAYYKVTSPIIRTDPFQGGQGAKEQASGRQADVSEPKYYDTFAKASQSEIKSGAVENGQNQGRCCYWGLAAS